GSIAGSVSECDIYENLDAGAALRELLQKGASVDWTDQLRDFMGTEEGRMNSSSIKAYFKPLEDYLDQFITNNTVKTT
ncbi:hypothetical protein GUF49_06790, partial [Xanthomonas citri pv. citri]|nr:hypothetical protein [Xanthomonas citri pv. citri]